MFVQISRRFGLAVLALAGAALIAACSGGVADDGEPRQLQQALKALECECTDGQGELSKRTCSDTCFQGAELRCGSAKAPCYEVCEYSRMTEKPGTTCEALGVTNQSYKGVCVEEGVGPGNLAGCCPDCVYPDKLTGALRCGGLSKPSACGTFGNECRVCVDQQPNDCIVPACERGECTVQNAPAGSACTTSQNIAGRCTAAGQCCPGCLSANGICLNGGEPGACGQAGAACVSCDNGLACDGKEQCDAGRCMPGTALKCDDGNVCTTDSCDDVDGCQFDIEAGTSCNDGDGCTSSDTCAADGSCSGTPVACDDGNDCTTDACDGGTCIFAPSDDGTECDDGSSCTEPTVTRCLAGVCSSILPNVTCHTLSNPCVTSSCGDDGSAECMEVNRPDATPCDDGNPCTAGDSCQAGLCAAGGTTDCDDNNPCTDDVCDATNGCVYSDVSGECADGDLCTTGDRCQNGECTGDAVECAASNECQAAGSCDAASGLCSVLFLSDGTACGDGGECLDGNCDGEAIPMAQGGAGGEPGVPGGAGEGGSGGSAGGDAFGGSGGTSGSGGTYSGEAFNREPKGCDCRSAPGGSRSGKAGLGLFGLGLLSFVRIRRRKCSQR